jgi:hypothetical protein
VSLETFGWRRAHATRGSVAKTPYFSWNISCLAVIMGETG